MGELQDKNSIMNVLGCLIKQPSLLSMKEYYLDKDDFPERFHRIIFAVIKNLYESGVEKIDAWEIDGFLQNYEYQYKVFEDNNGVEYINTIEELVELDNFEYHYNNIKKYSLLRTCKEYGIDISELYDDSILTPKEQEKMQQQLDEYTLEDIFHHFEKKFVEIKKVYNVNSDARGIKASENIDDVIDSLRESPDLGYPMNSLLMNTVFRGARRKKYYIRSLPSGFGKSRLSLADLLRVSVPEYYSVEESKWIKNDFREKVLFISTELEFDEIQVPSISYIAEVEEDKIVNSTCSDEEWERVEKAKEIFKKTEFWLEYLPDFTIEDVESLIERHVIENGITYCVFDYIHNSVSLMASIANNAKSNLREDQILLLFSSKLKELANKHDIFMLTGTQLNDSWKEDGGRDNSSVRGSRGIIDKADCGILGLPPTNKELEQTESLWKKGFKKNKKPNLVLHVFKNRGNRYKDVKIFLHTNLGTLRTVDCFVTDKNNIPIKIEAKEILNDTLEVE